MKGIVAYSAKNVDGASCILFERSFAGQKQTLLGADWETACEWLLHDFGDAFYITYNLEKFADCLFTLIPDKQRERIKQGESKVHVGNVKIFYVEKWLGLTRTDLELIQGNTYSETRRENNFFGLNNFLAEDRKEPSVEELVGLGEQVLEALDAMGIKPSKLTSPAGLYGEFLEGKVPVINESSPTLLIEAANYCLDMMNLEWSATYESNLKFPGLVNTFDRASAYPSEMVRLRDTDDCTVLYSRFPIPAEWAILKVQNVVCPVEINPLVNLERDKYTSEELRWIKAHGGTFNVIDGYYFRWNNDWHPYKNPLTALWVARNEYPGIFSEVCKRTANGISGKLDQENKPGENGALCNWVYAAMMRSRNRLEVANFAERAGVWDALIGIHVDCVRTYVNLFLPKTASKMGEWRGK